MGKFTFQKMSEILACIKTSSKVLLPPTPGCDAGVYKLDNDFYMVVSTDPCTGVPQDLFGWFLIQFASSDVALFGAQPTYASINLLGPEGTDYKVFKKIMSQACDTADKLRLDIITGHTGNYPSLSQIVGVCTVGGFVKKDNLIIPSNAKAGDLILMIKQLGLETLSNYTYANYEKAINLFGEESAQRLCSLIKNQTCVDEALLLAKCDGVHAMHDTTEGGLVTALNEMAETSSLGFEIRYEDLPIMEEMTYLQKYFNLSSTQILSTSSTGCIIASVSAHKKNKIIESLIKKKVPNKIIGRFSLTKNRTITIKNRKNKFPKEADDPYAKIFYSR